MKYYGKFDSDYDLITKAKGTEIAGTVVAQEISNPSGTIKVELDKKIDNPETKTNGQILEYNGTTWVAADKPSAAAWGNITGTLSDQTDLDTALAGKETAGAAAAAEANAKAYTDTAIGALPKAVVFKGTVGTGGTVSDLPTATAQTVGHLYSVITAGTYAGQSAVPGDIFIGNDTPSWVLIPAGEESSGTVTNVATGAGLTGGPITTTGTISIDTSYIANEEHAGYAPKDAKFTDTVYTHPSHTAYGSGLYKVTVDAEGHVSAATAAAKADITALGIPAQDTTYSAGTGLTLTGTTFNHTNGIEAGSAVEGGATRTLEAGGSFNVPGVSYDAQGHITSAGTVGLTLPAATAHTVTVKSGLKVDGTSEITGTSASSSGALSVELGASGVTAASYGNTTDLAPGYSGTFKVPTVTVNEKGVVTGAVERTITLPASDNTNTTYTFARTATNNYFTVTPSDTGTAQQVSVVETKTASTATQFYLTGVTAANGDLLYNTNVYVTTANVLRGAAWNDFAETRNCSESAGTVVCEVGNGKLEKATKRLQAGAAVVSDTYGMLIGSEEKGYAPIAVAGRVLVDIKPGDYFEAGDAVCADINGTVSKMTRREIRKYPDRILGFVSEIPTYREWNGIKVNNRIWIKIK